MSARSGRAARHGAKQLHGGVQCSTQTIRQSSNTRHKCNMPHLCTRHCTSHAALLPEAYNGQTQSCRRPQRRQCSSGAGAVCLVCEYARTTARGGNHSRTDGCRLSTDGRASVARLTFSFTRCMYDIVVDESCDIRRARWQQEPRKAELKAAVHTRTRAPEQRRGADSRARIESSMRYSRC